MEPRKRGKLVIVIGPSGGGKTTIVEEAIKRLPSAARLVTTTTRPRRTEKSHGKEEVDGVDYHFIDRAEFERRLERGEFLEDNEFNGNLYGSSRIVLEDMLRKYDVVLAILDVNGERDALHAFPEALSVFIRTESLADLRRRLEARGSSAEQIEGRLAIARNELASAHEFGIVITNREGRLEEAMDEFMAVIEGRAA